jgi:predicted alpha/beta hydrolase family esterase
MRRSLAPWAVLLLPFVFAFPPSRATADVPSGPCPVPETRVFVADGCGNLSVTASALARAATDAGAALCVERWRWSHGTAQVFRDHYGHANRQAHGLALADAVAAHRRARPADRICLVGHSSGCAVILAAAEALPPHSIDRIVLLAPAVSSEYDLGRALCSSREGIDSFHNRCDAVAVTLLFLGSTDGRWMSVAARHGFRGGSCAACGLRQHLWHGAGGLGGWWGGHFGWARTAFLHASVLPLLLGDGAP